MINIFRIINILIISGILFRSTNVSEKLPIHTIFGREEFHDCSNVGRNVETTLYRELIIMLIKGD